VDDVGGSQKVKVEGFPADVVALGSVYDNDLAILSVNALSDKPVLRLGVCGKTGSNFMTVGFQKEDKPYITPKLEGILGDLVPVKMSDSSEYVDAWDLKITNDKLVKGGNSGSPVVDIECGKVIAVVSHRQEEGKKGFAYSITALIKLRYKENIPVALLKDIEEQLSSRLETPRNREVVPLPIAQEYILTQDEREKLIALLCKLPDIQYASVHHSLVSTLPAQFQRNTDFDMPPEDHITEIVDTLVSDPNFQLPDGSYPIMVLIQNAINMANRSKLEGELQKLLDTLKNRLGVAPHIDITITTLDRFIQYLDNFILQMPALEYEIEHIPDSLRDSVASPECQEVSEHLNELWSRFLEIDSILRQSRDLKVVVHRFPLMNALADFNPQAKIVQRNIEQFCLANEVVLEEDQTIEEIQDQLDILTTHFNKVLKTAKKLSNDLH